MSTIVVVKKNGKAVIAADSCTTYNDGRLRRNADYDEHFEKIHRIDGSYVGIVGYCAHHMVFESISEKYPGDFSLKNRRHIFETALKLHNRLKKDYHVLTNEDDSDQPYESSQMDALIASPGGIFSLFSYRQVDQYAKFWAIGSGANFALGAMFAVYDKTDDAQVIAEIGIKAGATFDPSTSLPFSIYSVDLAEKK